MKKQQLAVVTNTNKWRRAQKCTEMNTKPKQENNNNDMNFVCEFFSSFFQVKSSAILCADNLMNRQTNT